MLPTDAKDERNGDILKRALENISKAQTKEAVLALAGFYDPAFFLFYVDDKNVAMTIAEEIGKKFEEFDLPIPDHIGLVMDAGFDTLYAEYLTERAGTFGGTLIYKK